MGRQTCDHCGKPLGGTDFAGLCYTCTNEVPFEELPERAREKIHAIADHLREQDDLGDIEAETLESDAETDHA